jgi:hypothetical protein
MPNQGWKVTNKGVYLKELGCSEICRCTKFRTRPLCCLELNAVMGYNIIGRAGFPISGNRNKSSHCGRRQVLHSWSLLRPDSVFS